MCLKYWLGMGKLWQKVLIFGKFSNKRSNFLLFSSIETSSILHSAKKVLDARNCKACFKLYNFDANFFAQK